MRGALAGGLGGIGLGLTWVGLAGILGRFAIPLGFVVLACALASAGLAFSESHYRLHAPWGFATLLGILGLTAFAWGPAWYATLLLLFAAGYASLGVLVHLQRHGRPHLPHFGRARVRT
ncbi:hypothetical protein FGE12_13165 [Aggregicoccus sp. 17bor-14]|uniref:hypothetical protein n=1 Tax=Myxococcaceae TaxID=31 RepID=UPI00129C6CC4|nr:MULTISPECIES: hypothetical protein [Myxococcaceae]MBF5043341.1 hypothetical protein [Simulacricoccus sp. 17bor-14]MRI89100.1 hypothetical protein [Aggregicoccus sp. 17bor-14]